MVATENDPLEQLLQLTGALSDANDYAELAEALTDIAAPLVGAANSAVGVLSDSGVALRVFQGPTATVGNATIRLMGLDEPTPLTDAARRGEPVLIESESVFASLYPRISMRIEAGDVTAMSTYPLQRNGETLGSCFFRFAHGAPVGPAQYRLMGHILPPLVRAVARIRDQTALVQYARQLEQSNRDLDNFAAVVAHDLSAPVRRIGSFLQLLVRQVEPLPPAAKRYADTIQSQVTHLDALLRDTLAYAQVVAPTDTHQPVALDSIIAEVLAPMRADLDEMGATVTVGEMPLVDVEASLFRGVFQNLLDNAVKYRSSRPPAIAITSEFEAHSDHDHRAWWTIRFSDNGIGIDPERSDEVFAMFARLEVSDDRPGTGVGLAFVKRVIDRHGGEIGLEPVADGGTTFRFTVPGVATPDEL